MAGQQGGSRSDWGSVEVEPSAAGPLDPSRGSSSRLRTARCIWRPPPDVAVELPPDFALGFDCLTGPDGVRRFARRDPVPAFVVRAALGGYALALFDLGPVAEALDETVARTVEDRLLAALERHVGDDTADFDRWFFTNTDNIVHAIAKQKKGGGRVPREVVRQALLELVFRSYRYVGDCVHLQATAFARALPDPLTGEERALFESLYRKRPYLGGLPLVLLRDRFAFLREAVLDVWAVPHDATRDTRGPLPGDRRRPPGGPRRVVRLRHDPALAGRPGGWRPDGRPGRDRGRVRAVRPPRDDPAHAGADPGSWPGSITCPPGDG